MLKVAFRSGLLVNKAQRPQFGVADFDYKVDLCYCKGSAWPESVRRVQTSTNGDRWPWRLRLCDKGKAYLTGKEEDAAFYLLLYKPTPVVERALSAL